MGDEAAFLRHRLPRRVLTDLRRGRWVLQGQIDLHGLTATRRARPANFLHDALAQGALHPGDPRQGPRLAREGVDPETMSRGWLAQREEIQPLPGRPTMARRRPAGAAARAERRARAPETVTRLESAARIYQIATSLVSASADADDLLHRRDEDLAVADLYPCARPSRSPLHRLVDDVVSGDLDA